MKTFTALQKAILNDLEDGLRHSGNELAKMHGVSRTTIWKQVNQLQDYGISVNSKKTGYQLDRPFISLCDKKITKALKQYSNDTDCQFHLFTSIHSTNRFLKELPLSDKIEVCLSEEQTQGRGRFNRQWISPFGENIYCSMRIPFYHDLSKLSGLSLIVSLAIQNSLKHLNISPKLQIKWPNDILWQGKKLSGNLIEVIAETNSCAQLIIGVGLNVNSHLEHYNIDKPCCSLKQITKKYHDRNQIIASLLANLISYLEVFYEQGLSKKLMNDWLDNDYLFNKDIIVEQFNTIIYGRAKGITETGQLILETNEGKYIELSSGDASIKK